MHRRTEVIMHRDGPPAGAPVSSSIDQPAFPSRPGITLATARSVGDGRSGATRSSASMASTGPSPQRAPWQAGRQPGLCPALALLALFEPIAVAVHFQDVDVVGQPIEQRAGQPLGPEHAGPLVERQIGSDDGGAALVALAEKTSNKSSAPAVDSGT